MGLMEPLVSTWFNERFDGLTEPQARAIPVIHERRNVLVSSPTGSGKTLIMHVNILQFLYYFDRAKRNNSKLEINNIIVLAPNENMAMQHLEELSLSSITAGLFNKDDTLGTRDADVIVVDMNKLREEGKAKTVSVD